MAFVKLRLPLMLKALPSRKTAVFAFVHPEHILSVRETPTVPDNVAASLAADVVGLSFKMQKPPVAVVPNMNLVPKNKSSGDALESLQSLSAASEFTLYLAAKHVSKHQVKSVSSIAGPQAWHSLPSFTNLSALYTGKGARIVESSAILPSSDVHVESPPSYDELALSTPEPASPARKKRRRESPEESNESLIRRVLAEEKAQMATDIQLQVEKAVNANLTATLDSRLEDLEKAVKANFTADLDTRLGMLEKRLLSHLDMRIDREIEELREDVEGQIEQLREEVDDAQAEHAETTIHEIDFRIDDQLMGVKEELSDHVREELRDTEERVREAISATAFSIDVR